MLAAARFYETQRRGLGLDYIDEVRRAVDALIAFPGLGHRFSKRLDRIVLRRFPYALIYRAEPRAVVVVAVAHLRRRPGYWRRRT